ncbi:Crp/Fnr family transcriptional regulator [Marinobacter sp.]|uniref:Crp/Fnr family transcriptional regulator n=1 Tax=Marinobacter sp. TaxID=50741 RepID=UPI00384F9C3B
MLGASLILDLNRATQRGITQASCIALRMKAVSLQPALQSHPALRNVLQRYLYVVIEELLQTTGCIRFHDVGKRLARGLLLAHDRACSDHFVLTHLVLAEMPGVQRGAVTIAAAGLQRAGIIRYRRGKISILDRKQLEATACGCYRARTENYAGILA